MSATFCVFLVFIAVMCLMYLWYALEEYINVEEDRAYQALYNWRRTHPNCSIRDWPHAQQLVLDRIVTHEIWLAFNPYVKRDEKHFGWLLSLLT